MNMNSGALRSGAKFFVLVFVCIEKTNLSLQLDILEVVAIAVASPAQKKLSK